MQPASPTSRQSIRCLRRINAVEAFDLTAAIAAISALDPGYRHTGRRLVPCTCSIALADQLPHVRLALLDHGGHACNVTDPAGFDAMVTAFLREP